MTNPHSTGHTTTDSAGLRESFELADRLLSVLAAVDHPALPLGCSPLLEFARCELGGYGRRHLAFPVSFEALREVEAAEAESPTSAHDGLHTILGCLDDLLAGSSGLEEALEFTRARDLVHEAAAEAGIVLIPRGREVTGQ